MHKTISKNSGALDLDYETMRLDALALLQKLSGNLWTDFNTHDPGVTLLEGIVFALSELGYKTGFDIEDYLTDKTGKIDLSRSPVYERTGHGMLSGYGGGLLQFFYDTFEKCNSGGVPELYRRKISGCD